MRCALNVTVVIPAYNRRHLVGRAIDSALGQTTPPSEVIVVDDGSTDGTAEWLDERYGQRIRVIAQPNQGCAVARNTGILAAATDLVAFLDSDDEWLPEKLERQLPLMQDPDVVLSFTNWSYAVASGRTSHPHRNRPSGFKREMFRSRDCPSVRNPLALLCGDFSEHVILPTWIICRHALLRVGMFDPRMKIASDTKLLFQMAFEGCFASCAEPLCRIYMDDDRGHAITRPADPDYARRHTAAMIGILMEAYAKAGSEGLDEQRFIRMALSSLCAGQALGFARAGSLRTARNRGLEALAFGARGGCALRAIGAVVCPRLLGALSRAQARRRAAAGDQSMVKPETP